MHRKVLTTLVAIFLAVTATTHLARAFPLDSATRTCLTMKYGAKVALAIGKAKTLNATQKKQLAVCVAAAKPPSGGTSGGMSAADVGAVPGMRIGTRSPARAALITLSASATAINRQLAASRADALRGCSNAIAPSVPRGLIR